MSILRWLLGLVRRPKRARPPRDARGRFARRFRVADAAAEIQTAFMPAMRDQVFAPSQLFVRLKARSRLLAVRDARGRFVRFTRIEARAVRRPQKRK